ncbi:MAG: ATP-binding cassette domain-containing protein [Rhizonema sp. PD37]|nr:ATP-binding cassette domain-containing protein [Rhizonema sp. PD37]
MKFRDRALKQQLRSVAYVPQRSSIDWDYPQYGVDCGNDGAYSTYSPGQPSSQSREIVKAALHRVGMLDLRSRQIGELSGGQQQRVFLARALAHQAELFFFDESLVGVDKKTESIMFDVFSELKSQGKILLVITHDLAMTLTKCDFLLLLNKQLIAQGSIKEVVASENLQRAYGDNILLLKREEV